MRKRGMGGAGGGAGYRRQIFHDEGTRKVGVGDLCELTSWGHKLHATYLGRAGDYSHSFAFMGEVTPRVVDGATYEFVKIVQRLDATES